MINAAELQEKRICGPGEAQLKGIIKIHCTAGPRSRHAVGKRWGPWDTDTPFGILGEY